MRSFYPWIAVVVALMLITPEESRAIGRGGGGVGGGGARGGISAGGARASLGSRAPSSAPSLGGSRPNISRPSMNQPSGRPNLGGSNLGGSNLGGSASRPQLNRPSGGLNPSRPTPPNLNTRPTTRPGLDARPPSRPNTSLPNLGSSRPSVTRPDLTRPDLNRPNITRPDLNRPNVTRPELNRPNVTRPELSRPDLNRPGIARPGGGFERPNLGDRPNVGRPSPGDIGDFLGMDRPIRPEGGGIARPLPGRPGLADRPGLGDRPGIGDRPNLGDRPGMVDRRPNFDDRSRWNNNRVINTRPAWVNIDNSININIHNRWNNAFTNVNHRGWWVPPANRIGFWRGWAGGVRGNWVFYHQHGNWFTGSWWGNHYFPIGGWHYHHWNHNRPWGFWWTFPVWNRVTTWFTWSAPQTVWAQPVFYDYGTGGNVTFQENNVYIGGERIATTDEFAQSAMDLATVAPPDSEQQAAETEWLPLGTFAVSTNEKDVQPSQVVQLAVSREGIISGTLYNVDTNEAQTIQGQVDKETQRVAFRIGESEKVVAETGLYNLTQEEAPVLVHFGTERSENYLLVRLEQPDEEPEDP